MADIITSDQLFYTAQAADIWSSINPQLGEQIGLAAAVANGIRVYNIAYPPPPPGNMWSGITGIVLIAGAIAIGVAAYYAYAASAAGAAGSAAAVSSTAGADAATMATGVNTAATTVAASTAGTAASTGAAVSTTAAVGTTTSTYSMASVVGYAQKAAAIAGPIFKASGNTKAASLADAINSPSVTDVAKKVLIQQAQAHNLKLSQEAQAKAQALIISQQQQYAQYKTQQQKAQVPTVSHGLPTWALIAIPVTAAIVREIRK